MAGEYITRETLKADPAIPDTMSDADADDLIRKASRYCDSLLPRVVDPTTGRKVVQGDVEAWQWGLLGEAVVAAAVLLYTNPTAFTPAQWDSVSGPDFSKSGPRSGGVTWRSLIAPTLRDAGLLPRQARAADGPPVDRRPGEPLAGPISVERIL